MCGVEHPGLGIGPYLDRFFKQINILTLIPTSCIALFVLALVIDLNAPASSKLLGILSPDSRSLYLLGMTGGLARGDWWTILTATYLHGGALHIFFNLLSLRFIGSEAENVFGLLAALIVHGRSQGSHLARITRRIWVIAILFFIFGFMDSGVNNYAHLGGFIGGWIASKLLVGGAAYQGQSAGYHLRHRAACTHGRGLRPFNHHQRGFPLPSLTAIEVGDHFPPTASSPLPTIPNLPTTQRDRSSLDCS